MANMVRELRKRSSEELVELIAKCKEQLLQIRFSVANGEAENLHHKQEIRKTIARSLTILNERSQEAQKNISTSKSSTSIHKTTTKQVHQKGEDK